MLGYKINLPPRREVQDKPSQNYPAGEKKDKQKTKEVVGKYRKIDSKKA